VSYNWTVSGDQCKSDQDAEDAPLAHRRRSFDLGDAERQLVRLPGSRRSGTVLWLVTGDDVQSPCVQSFQVNFSKRAWVTETGYSTEDSLPSPSAGLVSVCSASASSARWRDVRFSPAIDASPHTKCLPLLRFNPHFAPTTPETQLFDHTEDYKDAALHIPM
jgi:hypothetical protein